MNLEKQQTYDYYFWKSKMPPYPESNGLAGAKVSLTPILAATILTKVALGANPRDAFIQEGISERTYSRYLKRAEDENETGRYLRKFFELENTAQEVTRDKVAKARLALLNQEAAPHVTQTRVIKTRKVVLNGKVVRLRDIVTTKTIHYPESSPSQNFIFENKI